MHEVANQGDSQAQYNLAILYSNGKSGVPQDDKVALEWCRKAADLGFVQAQYALAEVYCRGDEGVTQDLDAALKWIRKAEAQGYAEAADLKAVILRMQQSTSPQENANTSCVATKTVDAIDLGARVEVKNVPQLKGRRGYVIEIDDKSGKCTVKLDDDDGTLGEERFREMDFKDLFNYVDELEAVD